MYRDQINNLIAFGRVNKHNRKVETQNQIVAAFWMALEALVLCLKQTCRNNLNA